MEAAIWEASGQDRHVLLVFVFIDFVNCSLAFQILQLTAGDEDSDSSKERPEKVGAKPGATKRGANSGKDSSSAQLPKRSRGPKAANDNLEEAANTGTATANAQGAKKRKGKKSSDNNEEEADKQAKNVECAKKARGSKSDIFTFSPSDPDASTAVDEALLKAIFSV